MPVKPEPFSTTADQLTFDLGLVDPVRPVILARPAKVLPLGKPTVRRVAEDRALPYVGIGSQLLYEVVRDWTDLSEPLWEDRLMIGWNGRYWSTTPDATYWSRRIAIYADGRGHITQMEEDHERRNLLHWAGFQVLVFTNRQLASDPCGVAELLQGVYHSTPIRRAA